MSTPQALAPTIDDPVGAVAEQGFTLPAKYYTDPGVYEQEKNAIFYRSWQYVCHDSMLTKPGDYTTKLIGDENIFIIRGHDDELRGFYNVCRHRAHQLLQGAGNTDRIVCPYHAWTYSHTGALTHARNSELVQGFDKSSFCLHNVALENFCGFIFANLDPQATSLNELVPDLAEDLRHHLPYLDNLEMKHSAEFGGSHIKAGWKVVVDNYLECYHCPGAHRDFASIIDMEAYEMDSYGLWSRQLGKVTRHDNSAYDFSSADVQQRSAFWFLWPNTTFNVLPGTENLSVMTISPHDAQSSSFTGHQFGLDNYQIDDSRTTYLNEVLGPEDQALCESVQRGLKSRSYDQGRFIVDPQRRGIAEHAVHQFHRLVYDALN